MLQRKTVKKILVIFIILLPVQYGIVGVVGLMKSEPWPAFVLPAFKSVFSSQENITVDRAQFFVEDKENATLTEISPEVIFTGIKKSQLQGFLRSHFADSLHIAHFDDETKAWLRDRLKEYYPSLKRDNLQIRWSKELYTVSNSSLKPDSIEIMKQFSFSLTGE